MTNIAVDFITIFNGKIHYKMVVFNSYVKLPEGKNKKMEMKMEMRPKDGEMNMC